MGAMLSCMRSCGGRRKPAAIVALTLTNTPVVGLTGAAGAGKDTAARILVEAYGYKRLAFADPIKDGLAGLLSLPRHVFDDPTLKERPIEHLGERTPRALMQWMGTDVLRKQIGDDVFLRIMAQRINEVEGAAGVVVTDVRFDDEARLVRSAGGVVVRIARPGAGAALAEDERRHPSENGVDPALVDLTILNDGTKHQLWRRVERALVDEPCSI